MLWHFDPLKANFLADTELRLLNDNEIIEGILLEINYFLVR